MQVIGMFREIRVAPVHNFLLSGKNATYSYKIHGKPASKARNQCFTWHIAEMYIPHQSSVIHEVKSHSHSISFGKVIMLILCYGILDLLDQLFYATRFLLCFRSHECLFATIGRRIFLIFRNSIEFLPAYWCSEFKEQYSAQRQTGCVNFLNFLIKFVHFQ